MGGDASWLLQEFDYCQYCDGLYPMTKLHLVRQPGTIDDYRRSCINCNGLS